MYGVDKILHPFIPTSGLLASSLLPSVKGCEEDSVFSAIEAVATAY